MTEFWRSQKGITRLYKPGTYPDLDSGSMTEMHINDVSAQLNESECKNVVAGHFCVLECSIFLREGAALSHRRASERNKGLRATTGDAAAASTAAENKSIFNFCHIYVIFGVK